jgi:hypothetical protein
MRSRRKRQNGNVPCPFNSDGHLSLVFSAVPRNPPRNDLSSFRNEISKDPRIPIVDVQFLIGAESTDLSPQEGFFLSFGCWPFSRLPHAFLLSSSDPCHLLMDRCLVWSLPSSGGLSRSPPYEFDFYPLVFSSCAD